jgi:hypothetical protein
MTSDERANVILCRKGKAEEASQRLRMAIKGSGTILIILIGFFAFALARKPPPYPAPEQVAQEAAARAALIQEEQAEKAQRAALIQEEQAEKAQRAAQAEKAQRTLRITMCTCKRYAAVRQECAVAGNFENCIKVRMMGDSMTTYDDLANNCADDGTVRWQPEKVPSSVQCFLFNLFSLIAQ